MIVKNQLAFHFLLICQSYYFGVARAGSIEGFPVIKGTQCQSRALPPGNVGVIAATSSLSEVGDDGNLTSVEGLVPNNLTPSIPYCPDGYVCGLSEESGTVLGLCKSCSGSSNKCAGSPDSIESLLGKAEAQECQEQCGIEKNTCSKSDPCPSGLFCNFENGPDSGFCEGCPLHMFYCENVDGNLSAEGLAACYKSCDRHCIPPVSLAMSNVTLAPGVSATNAETISDVNIMFGSPQMKRSGPVVDCGLGLTPCEGAEGAVCLIERGKAPFVNKTFNCHAGGGVAAVIYNTEASCENIDGTLHGKMVTIPVVSLTHLDGKEILKKASQMPEEAPLIVTVDVGGHDVLPENCILQCTKEIECAESGLTCNFDNIDFGDCKPEENRPFCNDGASSGTDYLPCSSDREFCDFSLGKRGFCNPCPDYDEACFFSDLNGLGVKECAAVCADDREEELEALNNAPCKFCPKGSFAIGDVGEGFISTGAEDSIVPCEFCASTSASTCKSIDQWDMAYPERTIRMFGRGVQCWAVAEFYRSLNIEADSLQCQSARSFNYICGCSDTSGYAGANTEDKQIALVWMPRVGAILSILGSMFMIIGVLRDPHKRKRVIGELIIFLCFFDIIGSIGYAFTSYPTPRQDYIYGAVGNPVSCTAQGFFIQLGTIALYANVSIAFYYLLIIQYSWREHTLRKSWVYRSLFVVPVILGCVFAFSGIPFYDNAVLWCNNSRNYWSEIPVMIGIGIATFVMINLCWFVWKSERASRRFRRHSEDERNSLSKAFFMQALVYLGSFYLTWPPYLALQLMIARGYAFSHYGFYLFAGTAVTLQGFWNFTFHTGLHTRTIGKKINRVWTSVRGMSTGSKSFLQSRSIAMVKSDDLGESPLSNGPVSSNAPAF